MALFGTHTGAWGTPEFGITEKISDLLGRGRTSQGGSNLLGSSSAQTPSGGQVLGQNTPGPMYGPGNEQGVSDFQSNQSTSSPSPTRNNGGTGGGGTPSTPDLTNPVKKTEYANSLGYPSWEALQEALNREGRTRDAIKSGFDNYKRDLQNLIPYYENQIPELVNQVTGTYDTIFSGLDEAKQAGMQKLDQAREGVQRRTSNSITDLQQNLNQVMRNTGMQLGAMGAGDTSASQIMAPYAYTKLAGQEFGSIQRQANDQFGEIDQKAVDVEQEYASLYNQTELEKQGRINSVRDSIREQVNQIRNLIPQVDSQRAQALAGLEQSLLDQARNTLAQIQAEDRANKQAIQQWALNRVAQLNDARLTLQNTANFNPRDIMRNELSSVGYTPTIDQSYEYYNPALIQKRREELGLS